ncbi:BTAD domain-containing putative transcriptional regulator [Streptomyces boninensis]|uniref:AfsR/SARP family transcriptional regulator n=1 Tax=Streptomyces boninensis TaxID=2039455 RepID=UPI003B226074
MSEDALRGTAAAAEQLAAGELRFAVLGPVRAWRGPEPLAIGSPQQRAMLAALLLRGGRTATAQELVDALWGEEPPPRALAALRTYASRLRKVLGAEALVSEAGGYAMRAVAHLDADRAADRAAAAEDAVAVGDLADARDLYGEALAAWDGEPLAGLPGPYADLERTRLEEWHLSLQEARLQVDLDSGHHADAVSELTALTAAHPLRERLRELLMLALYRSGRQAEALAVYADTRRLLADELGVDPRAELSELQERILRADEGLSAPHAPGDEAAEVPAVRPAQLPARVPDFTGRADFVKELGELLATADGNVMAVSAVAGIGGVGKTTLAVHVAHAARELFPDGQLYVDLQGSGTPAEPEAVLGSFLRALGTKDSDIPSGVEERSALYRSLLSGRRILALLDNARDAAQIRPLLPGAEGCAALITSRHRMVDLPGAHLVDLDVMAPDEALSLFTKIVGEERVRAEREASMDVVAACGFLPLAIRIAASRLAARRTWTVSVLASKLSDERRRLDELQAGDQAVKATFELGYGQLTPPQARAFRLLGLADGPDISLAAAAAMLDRTDEETEDLLESLVDASLLESAAPGRYRFHDLVRLYARACAERDEYPPEECGAALSRLLDFYLATAARVYELRRPGERLPRHLAPTKQPGLDFASQAAANDWLFAEAGCMLATVRQQAVGDTLQRAADLLLVNQEDLAESGVFALQYAQASRLVRDAAQAANDPLAEGRARLNISAELSMAGRLTEADAEAQHAYLLGQAADDIVVCSHVLNDRAIIATLQNRPDDAEAYLNLALEAFRGGRDPDEASEASALCNLSRVHVNTGRTASGVQLAEQSLAILLRQGAAVRQANARYTLGIALAAQGRLDDAESEYRQALRIFEENRQQFWEGMTLFRLAELHLDARRPAQSAAHAEQALARLRDLGGPQRRATTLSVLGKALEALGQHVRARACWTEALAIFEELEAPEAAELRGLLSTAVAA